MAETGFSHRLTAYKILGLFFRLSYRKISWSNQVKNSFFRISNISVTCPHAQLRGRTINKKLWTFFGPWGRDHSQSSPCWIFRVKQIHTSTASERTTRQDCTDPFYHNQTHILLMNNKLSDKIHLPLPCLERWYWQYCIQRRSLTRLQLLSSIFWKCITDNIPRSKESAI